MTAKSVIAPYKIRLPQNIYFGAGSLDNLAVEAKRMQVRKALIVTDQGVFKSGLVQPVQEILSKASVSVDVFSEAEPEPTLAGLAAAAKKLSLNKYDVLIGLGGGSSIDTAKGLSVLLAFGGDEQDYIGTDKIPAPGIKLIAIPTTAGTGSEVTNVAIFSDTEKELKVGMISDNLLAKVALVDPVLTYGCPRGVTAASGIDALVHGIECYTSNKSNSFTDSVAIRAMRLISGSLKTAVNNGSDKDARSAMAEGALLAGIAFGNSSVAAVHALAYPLGARFHVSHGNANGLLLPHVMKCNVPAAPNKYADIAQILGERTDGLTTHEAAGAGINAVKTLIRDIGIPSRLSDLNIPEEALEGMAVATMDVTRLLANNPRTLTLDDVRGIWRDAW
ncbi:MAG: iron-containing alcohol dehydrogenase [Sedimentisphaerales bacterium]|nr:iron-containing alcohol dehydrogenase [Sedimentisphaerales bacterium]